MLLYLFYTTTESCHLGQFEISSTISQIVKRASFCSFIEKWAAWENSKLHLTSENYLQMCEA
jgi:hypothetical protein